MGLFYAVLKVGNRGSEKKSFASDHIVEWKASVQLNSRFVCSEALKRHALMFPEIATVYLGRRRMSHIQVGRVDCGS